MIFSLIKMFFAVVLGIIYVPLNLLLLEVSKLYRTLQKDHPFDYWAIKILIFPLWLIVTVISIPYEWLVENAH